MTTLISDLIWPPALTVHSKGKRPPPTRLLQRQKKAIQICPDAEMGGICDTTGRATPNQVYQLFSRLMEDVDQNPYRWAYHGHDTFGLGVTNALHAYYAGG